MADKCPDCGIGHGLSRNTLCTGQTPERLLARLAEAEKKLEPMPCGHCRFDLTKGNLQRTDDGDCTVCLLHEELDTVRAVLAELLRLYDWRFELAKEEARARDGILLDDAAAKDGKLRWREETWRRNVEKKLAQYGREKKAAWARARKVLSKESNNA